MPRLPRRIAASRLRLPVQGERHALDLLVVLELHLEQAHEFHRDARRPGDPDNRVVVRREDLLDVALRR
jgi:hypothetical protein